MHALDAYMTLNRIQKAYFCAETTGLLCKIAERTVWLAAPTLRCVVQLLAKSGGLAGGGVIIRGCTLPCRWPGVCRTIWQLGQVSAPFLVACFGVPTVMPRGAILLVMVSSALWLRVSSPCERHCSALELHMHAGHA
jgi:hypothetical protein